VHAQAGGQGAYTGELYSGPHRFDVPMQKAAFKWLRATFRRRALSAGPVCLRDRRLLLCCALPRRVVFGEKNQPDGERYRGRH
jgi:hypothetical protein